MLKKRVFYAQSGGMTSVINATAYGVIKQAREFGLQVYAGKNGLLGALNNEFFDTEAELEGELEKLLVTPGGVFGSCRCKLPNPEEDLTCYRKIIKYFKQHDIGIFLCNGGNDSQDVACKISLAANFLDYPLVCIGIPKTIDNDLFYTDTCPGYGSAAKFVANVTKEIDLDLVSMSASSTKVFILEVMGRHTGWIAAASSLAKDTEDAAPHIVLVPEQPVSLDDLVGRVQDKVKQFKRCVIVVSEGICDLSGERYANSSDRDQFGHCRLGGVAVLLAEHLKKHTGFKIHWAVAGYLQRSARHLASLVDFKQAMELGKYAVDLAFQGTSGYMVNLVRDQDDPYSYHLDKVLLNQVANLERALPANYFENGELTVLGRRYLFPLIQGEAPVSFKNGIIHTANLKKLLVETSGLV